MLDLGNALRWGMAALALGMNVPAVAVEYPERLLNKIQQQPMPAITTETERLHASLFIADMHADVLLWDRDLRNKSNVGHVDLPRLREGHVALQVFSVVSKIPIGINVKSNSSHTDELSLLMMLQAWPASTWFDVKARARYQAEKLLELEKSAPQQFMIVRKKQDLQVLSSPQNPPVAGLLALEGVQPLQGKMANFDEFFALGYRMMGLTHFFDNEAAGSAHGKDKGGLTEFGKTLVDTMQEKGVVVDLAHASAQTIADVTARAKKPVVVSHTGVKAVCPSQRNLSDEQLHSIAHTGGVIGVGFWPEAACDISPAGIAKSILHVVKTVGVDHVGLGSDFNGSVTTAIDSSQLIAITQVLREQGLADEAIAKVMGGNVRRVLMETLPD